MKLKKKSKTTSKKVHQEKKRSLAVKKKEKKNQANSNAKQQKKLKRGNDPQEGKPSKKQRRMGDEKATTEKQLKLKRKSRGQQSTDGENSAPAKEEPNAKTENKDAMSTKKRRRPWRQAIRHKAKRERVETEQQQLEENSLNSQTTENQEDNDSSSDNQPDESDDDEPTIENEEDSAQKKPKKRSRAKRLRQKQRLMAGLQNGEGSEEHGEQQMSSSKTAGNGVDQRLDASRFRFINEQLYTQPSSSAAQLFADDPAAFDAYHRGYKQQLKKWPANPLLTLALDLASLPRGSVVADLGCGEAELARLLLESSAAGSGPNKNDGKKQQPPKLVVHSFDLVAANKRVVAADMANLPLENGSVDVCVFCLSLMGTNLAQFFREAHRILKMGGKVKIAEVTSRFQNVNVFVAALTKLGFQLKRKKEIGNGFFTMLSLQKVGKIENKRPLGLQLQPCLYKKR